jgi:carbamoyl-phosphate synthase large subunit
MTIDDLRVQRLMVTGAGGPAGTAVIEELERRDIAVLAVDVAADAAGFFLASESAVVPRYVTDGYGDVLADLAVERGCDGIVSTISEEMVVLSHHVDRVKARGLAIWTPPSHALRQCVDKWAFAETLGAAHVPTPMTALGMRGSVPGPWVVKPRFGRGSNDVIVTASATVVDVMVDEVPDAIVQHRIVGREFTADCLVDRGERVRGVVARWRSQTRGGISVKGTVFESAEIVDAVQATVSAIGLEGPINLQGFVGDDGAVTVIEVNPRFSGALPLSIHAGADLVGEFVRGMFGLSIRDDRLRARPGVTMIRRFVEHYVDVDPALEVRGQAAKTTTLSEDQTLPDVQPLFTSMS